jgi:hypothetical protein
MARHYATNRVPPTGGTESPLTKHWDIVADSGNVKTRGFCPNCGSPVSLTFSATPDSFTVHAASLDDPGRYKPQVVTYRARGYPWDKIDPSLPAFDEMPPK